ncbi:MAG TPA: alpha/beta hydrolase [Ramlibacter sp.]|uniref:alpha/beta hydrolase family protein n=1 Tax=Ramlibacter sp. TaxID=1917967 RepID=UPI002ED235F0
MREEPFEIITAGGKLSGTLALPETRDPWPVVLLISGSGPTDRDGNSALVPGADGFMKRLAQALAAEGLASLRYDKRGVGASEHPGLREDELRFRHMVDDALALAAPLRDDARFTSLLLAGHSEGGLIAALAAREAQAAAVVSISGAGQRASDLLRTQLQGKLPEVLEVPALATLDALAAEQLVEDPPEALTLLFRPSVQPYLVSWFRFDPAEVLADLPVPVLVVHGAADGQVPPSHARLLHEARPDARLLLVEGMDHLLAVEGDAGAGACRIADAIAALAAELQRSEAA